MIWRSPPDPFMLGKPSGLLSPPRISIKTLFLVVTGTAIALAGIALAVVQRRSVEDSQRLTAADVKIQWAAIPGGSFMMGSGTGKGGPVHLVRVKAFQLAKTPVTNKQYMVCVYAGACAPPPIRKLQFTDDDQPVVYVTWNQARQFSKWVGGRLPSEAEWEYAARSAGKDWKYPWGNEDVTCERAVISDNSAGGDGCGRNATWPVCSKPKGNTEQGLCDMSGNVWEWVQDWHHASYEGAPSDGSAWESPAGYNRVERGGSWYGAGEYALSAHRGSAPPIFVSFNLGFRPAR